MRSPCRRWPWSPRAERRQGSAGKGWDVTGKRRWFHHQNQGDSIKDASKLTEDISRICFFGDFYGILSSKIGIGWWIWAHTSAGGEASTTQRNTHSCQDWCILSKVWAVPIYFFPHFNFAKKLLPIINPGCQDVSKQPPSLKNDRRLSCSNHTGFDNRAKETWILKLLPAAWAALSD